MTYRRNRNQNFNKEAGQGVLNVLVFDFQEILGTLLQKDISRRVTQRRGVVPIQITKMYKINNPEAVLLKGRLMENILESKSNNRKS